MKILALLTVLVASAISLHISPGAGTFTLIYATPWSPCYLHYDPNNEGWNSIPGTQMGCPTNLSYPCSGWKEITVAGDSVVWVTTDGSGQWDNNNGQNYRVTNAGIYQLQSGKITTLQLFPDTCPGTPECSGHGNCTNGICVCNVGYYGASCNRTCTCAAHEQCNSQGQCVCQSGWSSCNNNTCDTQTGTDPLNCGKCGNSCFTAHVSSAVCVSGQCNATCDAGFTACSDGTCSKECGLPGCNTYQENQCSGNAINTSKTFSGARWQTFASTSKHYRASYQNYSQLQGHARTVYTDGTHSAAAITLVIQDKDPQATHTCSFDAGASFSSQCTSATYTTNQTVEVFPVIRNSNGAQLILDPVDFIWNHPKVAHSAGDYRQGQKGSIVEMFGWRHVDVMNECEFVSRAGYLGVKFFPVQEQLMSEQPFNNVMNPWYFMYQPVSYRLAGRMGTRDELRAAINKCRSLNVRTYADAVVNHMTGCGNDVTVKHRNGGNGYCNYWPAKTSSADFPTSSQNPVNGSSPFFTQCFAYEPNEQSNLPPMQEFPGVPYSVEDFHCERPLNSWNDPLDLNAGWLTGLCDLNTEKESVRQRIADYMTDLLGVGFSGFRIDAAKHIQPPDWGPIFAMLKQNLGGAFPADFVVWMEVLTGGEGDMLLCNPDSGYSYSKGLENILLSYNLTMEDVTKIKIWFDAYPKQPGIDCGELEMDRKAIQNDDADQQNPGSTSRDMGSDGTVLVIAKDIPLHQYFEEKLFYDPNGASDNDNDYPIRMVLSSYWLPENANDYGVPDGNSNCDVCTIDCSTCDPAQSMNFTAGYRQGAQAYDTQGRFTRTHRYIGTINAMRWWMHLPNMSIDEYELITKF